MISLECHDDICLGQIRETLNMNELGRRYKWLKTQRDEGAEFSICVSFE